MISSDQILLYKYGNIYTYNISDEKFKRIAKFPFSFSYNLLARISLISRLFRLNIRYGIKHNSSTIILIRSKHYYELNIIKNKLIKGKKIDKGNRPLNITNIKNIKGFNDGIYYGEYFINPSKEEVCIKRIDTIHNHITVYTFPSKSINHIHSLIPDISNNCVWILTGDTDNSATIWCSKNNFNDVYPVFMGNQKYRSCVAFPINNGLLYATDSPDYQNAIYFIYKEKEKWNIKKICNISGPSIYGCKIENKFIFSTSVEPSSSRKMFLKNIFGTKRGKGILDNYIHVYLGNLNEGFNEIYKTPKDKYPFFLFQFGVITFPNETLNNDLLPLYHIATSQFDLSTNLIKI